VLFKMRLSNLTIYSAKKWDRTLEGRTRELSWDLLFSIYFLISLRLSNCGAPPILLFVTM
jgi:hypothetical protein